MNSIYLSNVKYMPGMECIVSHVERLMLSFALKVRHFLFPYSNKNGGVIGVMVINIDISSKIEFLSFQIEKYVFIRIDFELQKYLFIFSKKTYLFT
jgi:hypothetical protein